MGRSWGHVGTGFRCEMCERVKLIAIDVAVQRADVDVTALAQPAGDFFSNRDGAVVTTGTANAYRDEVLSFMAVASQHRVKHVDEVLDEGLCSIT